MNERDMYRILMIAAATLAVIGAASTTLLLVLTIVQGLWLIIPTLLVTLFTIGCLVVASLYGKAFSGQQKVFSNEIEQEVLNRKQRRELRNARGGLVMQRALEEIQKEQDNIVHRQIEAANDPTKPPHRTRFNSHDDF